jgi:CubicO group peptidase (beta-lactamase class C family)
LNPYHFSVPRTAFLAILALAWPCPAAVAQDSAGPLAARIDTIMAGWSKPDSPGCAVGVVRDGGLVLARGYGQADLEHGVPNGPGSVFDIGSMSKQLTAAVIVLLARDGKLSLDDDVRRFVPELPPYESPITIRHLLHHTSGLRDYTDLMALAGWQTDDWTTEEQALDMLSRQTELNFPPGSRYLYSNSGYFLLSIVAARAGGKPFPELARERIFAPLGMTSTHVHADHRQIVKDRALGYSKQDGRWTIAMSGWEQTGDGSVLTTVEDLARWVRNFDDPTVGGSALVAELLRRGKLASGEEIPYAAGLRHGTYRGLATVGHNGSWAGYRSSLLRFPSENTAVIVLCNADSAEAGTMGRAIADAALAARLGPAPTPSPGASPPAAERQAPPASRAAGRAALVGRYRSDELDAVFDVAAKGGGLVLRIRGRDSMLVPVGEDEWEAQDPLPLTVIATRDATARVTGLTLKCGCDGFRALRLVRVPWPSGRARLTASPVP